GAAVANPDQRLSRLPLLGGDERHQLLLDYNAKTRVYPSRLTIHELFQQQAERTPGAVAVLYKEDQLKYRELNARANQLAHYLRKLGVGPDVRVGLLFERSIEMVVALLGVLKAGGAYLPLDPAYPAERLEFMMADAEIPVLITLQNLADELQIEHANVICLDKEGDSINAQSIHNPTINTSSANAAYIIYTSRSTGQPKAAVVTHANVVRLFSATRGWFTFNEKDTWTLFHSYAFDFSVWELWGALLYGGRLVVVPYWVSRSPEAFYELICTHQVTVLNQTPSAFYQFM